MRKNRHVLLALISFILCSCSKTPLSNGVLTEKPRQLNGKFRVLEMEDDVDVRLVRETNPLTDTTKVNVKANENLMANITTHIHGDTLTIRNENNINWVRPYDYTAEVTVYYDSIYKISCNSNGALHSDVLHGYTVPSEDPPKSRLYLSIEGGSGDVDLRVDVDRLNTKYNWGTSTVTLSGEARIANVSTTYNCHGPIDAQALETNYHYVYSYGTNKITVKAFHEVNASNYNNGVICYLRYRETRPETIWGHFDENNIWIPPYIIDVTHSCPENIVYYGEPNLLDSIVLN